jgi:xenotropic and polytropic retrovirus receptor 1
MKILLILFGFFNATYSSIWDLAMDWSLCNPFSPHPFLRDLLAFRRTWVYYAAMVLNVIIRFSWIYYVIFMQEIQHSGVLSFIISLAEVCRRGMWTIFRVENEHCANVNLFRASRDVPLPYNLPKPMMPPIVSISDVAPFESTRPATEARASSLGDIEFGNLYRAHARTRRDSNFVKRFSQVGNIISAAHAQDFQRKKRSDPLSGTTLNTENGDAEGDSSDDEDEEIDPQHDGIQDQEDDDGQSNPAMYRNHPPMD